MPTQTITTGYHTQLADKMFDAIFENVLDFRIELSDEAARQFIRRIKAYNNFDADAVLTALDIIDRLIPRQNYGEGNPNTGQRDYRLSVGREGSPVIYLDRWQFRDELSEDRMQLICCKMQALALADEADYTVEGRHVQFRFWWD